MENFKPVKAVDFERSPFKMVGKEWMLITAEDGGKANTMTASWGGFGVLWSEDVAFVVIRPSRFTKGFVDAASRFSLTFFDETFRKQLSYLGTASGRDEDKIAKAGLTLMNVDDAPAFEEANTIIVCEKLYSAPLEADAFIKKDIIDQHYKDGDIHELYFAKIISIYQK